MATSEDRFSSVRSPRYSGGRSLGFRSSLVGNAPPASAAQATPAPAPAIAGFDVPRSGFMDAGGDSSGAAPGGTAPGAAGIGPSASTGFATAANVAMAMMAPNPVSVMNAINAINNFVNEVPPVQTVDPETQTVAPFAISPMAMTADPSDAGAPGGGTGIGDAPSTGVSAAPGGIGEGATGSGIGDPGSTGVSAAPGGIGEGAAGSGIGDTGSVGVDASSSGVGVGDASADAGSPADSSDASAGDSGAGDGGDGGGGGGGGAGGCFITEAVMASGGQGDAAPELQILRYFRDKVMISNPVGQALVQQYYMLAPLVVEAVSTRPDGMQIFQAIKAQFIDKAIQEIQAGQMEQALRTYAEMIAFVTPFAIETTMGPGGQPDDAPAPGQEPVDDFATDAAMLAQSPEMAAAATGAQPMMPQAPGSQPGAYTGPMANPPQEPAISGMFARPAGGPPQQPRRY